MNRHPHLRAYMAGIVVPTMFLVVVITFFILYRSTGQAPMAVERIIVFPVALVPNIWGLWNMLYLGLQERRRPPIGLYGAALPFLLAPLGFALQTALGTMVWTLTTFLIGFPVALIVYYLAWKYGVSFFNELAGVA